MDHSVTAAAIVQVNDFYAGRTDCRLSLERKAGFRGAKADNGPGKHSGSIVTRLGAVEYLDAQHQIEARPVIAFGEVLQVGSGPSQWFLLLSSGGENQNMSAAKYVKLLSVLATVVAFAPGCGGAAGEAALQGSWKIAKMATKGEYVPDEKLNSGGRLVLDGNKYIMRQGDRVLNEWTFTVDSSKNPQQLLVSRGVSNGKERFSYLIFKIEGDTLTTKSGSRSFPNDFSIDTEQGCYVTVYQRSSD